MKSFSCVIRCLDTDVSSSVSKRLGMPMRSAGKRWICQLGSFLLFEHFSFFSICDFDSRLQQKTSGGSNRLGLTLWASERRHSEQQPEWFFYLLTSVIPRDKTCCELRRVERILPRCRPMKATFSPTDERRSNHKFNSNLIFYNLRFEPFFMSCRYNRTYLTMSQ